MSALESLFGRDVVLELKAMIRPDPTIQAMYGNVYMTILDMDRVKLAEIGPLSCFAQLPKLFMDASATGKAPQFLRYLPDKCKLGPVEKWIVDYLDIGTKEWDLFYNTTGSSILECGALFYLSDPSLTVRKLYLALSFLRELDEHTYTAMRLVRLSRLFPKNNVASLFTVAAIGPWVKKSNDAHSTFPYGLDITSYNAGTIYKSLIKLGEPDLLDDRPVFTTLHNCKTSYFSMSWSFNPIIWPGWPGPYSSYNPSSLLLLLASEVDRALKLKSEEEFSRAVKRLEPLLPDIKAELDSSK